MGLFSQNHQPNHASRRKVGAKSVGAPKRGRRIGKNRQVTEARGPRTELPPEQVRALRRAARKRKRDKLAAASDSSDSDLDSALDEFA